MTPVEGLRDAIEIGKLPVLRVNRMEISVGEHSFPALESDDKGHSGKPPELDDQNCHAVQDRVEKVFRRVKPWRVSPKLRVRGVAHLTEVG